MADNLISSVWRPVLGAAAVAVFGSHGLLTLPALAFTSLWAGRKLGSENAQAIGEVLSHLFTDLSSDAARERLSSLSQTGNHDIERALAIALKDSLEEVHNTIAPQGKLLVERFDDWFDLWDRHLKRGLESAEMTASLFRSTDNPDLVALANATEDEWWNGNASRKIPSFRSILIRWANEQQDVDADRARRRQTSKLDTTDLPPALNGHLAKSLLALTQQALFVSLREPRTERAWIAWQQQFLTKIAQQTHGSNPEVADQLRDLAEQVDDLDSFLRPILEEFAGIHSHIDKTASRLDSHVKEGIDGLHTHISQLNEQIKSLERMLADSTRTRVGSQATSANPVIVGILPPPQALQFLTNDQYRNFISSEKQRRPSSWSKTHPFFPNHAKDDPVSGITWNEAVAYCDWAGGRLPDSTTPLVNASDIEGHAFPFAAEWIDAEANAEGRVRKQFRDLRSGKLRSAPPDESVANVVFRCTTVEVAPQAEHVLLPGGEFLIGTNDVKRFGAIARVYHLSLEDQRPVISRAARRLKLRGIRIARYCVTNQEYWKFVQQTGHRSPEHWKAEFKLRHGTPFPCTHISWPVVNVNVEDAHAYCSWSGTRLPTGTEWERASRGSSGRLYPWGDEYESTRCNGHERGHGHVVGVNSYASGATPEGVIQMCGNVFEWTKGPDGGGELRGGSWKTPCELWGQGFVFRKSQHGFLSDDVGFRTVLP